MDYPEKLTPASLSRRSRWRLSPGTAYWLAAGLCGVTLAQVLFGLILSAMNQLSPARLFAEFMISQAAAALAFATVGVLIIRRHPANTVGWLFCAAGAGYGLTTWIGQYVRYTMVTRPGALPGGEIITWIYFWSWMPIVALAVVFLPLFFPEGRLPSARWRPLFWIAVAATALHTVVLALSSGPLDQALPEVSNPFASAASEQISQDISPIAIVLTLVSLAGAVAAPILQFRQAQGVKRQQLKWFAYATTLLVVAYVSGASLYLSGLVTDPLLIGILLTIALPFLAIAVGIAILRHRLYDIDVIINRTLVYGALSACVVGLYVLVVGYLAAIFRTDANQAISLVATAVVAVVFTPLREWLQRVVDRLLYGERNDPYAVLARLGARLEAALVPDEVLPTVVAAVKDALRLPYAAVALKRDDSFSIAAVDGAPVAEPLRLPLSYQGDVVGQLLVSPRAPGEDWTAGERLLLDDLARHAGVAVHGVRVMSELQRARERLVLAREEERRRIRRDLHDDVAPSLAALALTAATVGELISTNPQAAAEANAKLQKAIRGMVGDVRRLVYDLRPPVLDELGLIEAIREQAARYNSAPVNYAGAEDGGRLQVTLDVPERLPPLVAAVEVAAYRIVQEALMNVSRHARAHTCTIRVACANGRALEIEVIDDGVGLPPAGAQEFRAGVGLRSMRERAAELGGVCEISSVPPQGTRVAAWLPIVTDNQEAYEEASYSHRR